MVSQYTAHMEPQLEKTVKPSIGVDSLFKNFQQKYQCCSSKWSNAFQQYWQQYPF